MLREQHIYSQRVAQYSSDSNMMVAGTWMQCRHAKQLNFSGRGLTGSIGLKSEEPLSVPGHQRYEGELDSLRDVRSSVQRSRHARRQEADGSIAFALFFRPPKRACVGNTKLCPLTGVSNNEVPARYNMRMQKSKYSKLCPPKHSSR